MTEDTTGVKLLLDTAGFEHRWMLEIAPDGIPCRSFPGPMRGWLIANVVGRVWHQHPKPGMVLDGGAGWVQFHAKLPSAEQLSWGRMYWYEDIGPGMDLSKAFYPPSAGPQSILVCEVEANAPIAYLDIFPPFCPGELYNPNQGMWLAEWLTIKNVLDISRLAANARHLSGEQLELLIERNLRA